MTAMRQLIFSGTFRIWPSCLLSCLVSAGSAQSQPADALATAPSSTRAPMDRSSFSQPSSVAVLRVKKSLDQFERLLDGTEEEREKILASKTDPQRKFLRNELKRLDPLTSTEREVELISMRNRYYLRELVKWPSIERQAALAVVPEVDRRLVVEKLKRWDRLPPDLQSEVLQNERTVRYVLQLEGLTSAERKKVLPALPESLRKSWGSKLSEWQALPPEHRQRIYSQANRYFKLSAEERAKVLDNLPAKERRQAEESIKALENLPAAERAACLESVPKMLEMQEQSRDQFIDTLERWNAMSAKERQMWKNVTTVLPPGSLPPMPDMKVTPAPKGENKQHAPPAPGTSK